MPLSIIQVQSKILRNRKKDTELGISYLNSISTLSLIINIKHDFSRNASCYLPVRLFSSFDDKYLIDLVNQSRQRISKES